MANYRKSRINEEVQKELSEIIREVKDPRVARAFVSITAVDVSADLKFAKVYYSTLGRCDEKEVKKGLVSAHGFIRTQIARRLNLRQTPEFTFIKDNSAEHGAYISGLLKKVEEEFKESEERERLSEEAKTDGDE